MGFVEELTQLLVVVAILILAYFGVMIWTKKAAKGGGGGADDLRPVNLADESDFAPEIPKKGHNKSRGRFNLQGKDAEVAAKVLKRMLKQDGGEKD